MNHECPTGYHQGPSRRCYWHGCRCLACLEDHTDYDAARNGRRRVRRPSPAPAERSPLARVDVSLPRRPWERIVTHLERRGTCRDEFVWRLADYLERTV